MMPTILRGVVHGKTIAFDAELGLPDGQEVTVTVEPALGGSKPPPGEGLRHTFGTWADDASELDEFLEEVRRARGGRRREIEP